MDKALLRARFSGLRKEAARADPEAARALAERIGDACRGDIIASYHAIGDELDPELLVSGLRGDGACIALPRLDESGVMKFCLADPARMETGAFGIVQPDASCPPVNPDVILVPLLACDRSGARLGRGGGHYDRVLAALDADGHCHLRVGLAFEVQVTDALPCEAHDQRLHRIETPSRSITCSYSHRHSACFGRH